MASITKENFKFLQDLEKNNDRDWFTANKKTYEKFHQEMITFADELLAMMNQHDTIETESGKKSLFRIYRDVRFSKDKSPYKTHWSGGFTRATKLRRGGYYFHVQTGGQSFIGGGFWAPSKEDLQRIREEIVVNGSEMRDLITAKDFVDTFGTLDGEQLKKAPKGFDADHPDIDLLRYKQFIFGRQFTDEEVLSPNFIHVANETFQKMRPFFDFMSDVLTSDSNGVPLFDE